MMMVYTISLGYTHRIPILFRTESFQYDASHDEESSDTVHRPLDTYLDKDLQ